MSKSAKISMKIYNICAKMYKIGPKMFKSVQKCQKSVKNVQKYFKNATAFKILLTAKSRGYTFKILLLVSKSTGHEVPKR